MYRRHVEPHFALSRPARQRFKLLLSAWGYYPLRHAKALSPAQRLWLLWRCLRIDWAVPHGHEPRDCSETLAALCERRARPGEVMVEAGCWQGGSTAKWSLACQLLGYHLHVYDSFQGVEARTEIEGRHDFTGEYAAPLERVRNNLRAYGDLSVCTFHEGWFRDTMKPNTVPGPVRLVYIDCDLVKGTEEVLHGVVPVLSDDGVVASQDGQIPVVAAYLAASETWQALGVRMEGVRRSRHLLLFRAALAAPEST